MFCEQYILGPSTGLLEGPYDSFQSHDRLEDLEAKTSIELQHKHVNYFPATNIRSTLKE